MALSYIFAIITLFYLGLGKKLSVTSVTTLESQPSDTYLWGSINGGTVLYIKGTGFQENPSLNSVMVGDYPCIIPSEGLKEESMTCTTTSIYPQKDLFYRQIVITSNKQKVVAAQKFSYYSYYTAELMGVLPFHSYSGQKIYFMGQHRITDLGDGVKPGKIQSLYTGDALCSRVGIVQNPLFQYNKQGIACNQSQTQEAGKYSLSQQTVWGYAKKTESISKTSLDGQKYEYMVFPTVSSIFPKNGSIAGQQLTIKGSGFPKSNSDKRKVQVMVDDTECQVVQTSVNEIKCNLKKKSATSQRVQNSINTNSYTYLSGSGFKYRAYEGSISIDEFIASESTFASPKEEGIRGELQSRNFQNNYRLEIFEGFFYAPNTGNYTFTGYSSRQFKAFLNIHPGVPSINISSDLLINGSYNLQIDHPYMAVNSTQTKTLSLTGGNYYYMKVFNSRLYIGDAFKIFTQIPNLKKELGWRAPQIDNITLNFTNQQTVLRFRSLGAKSGTIKFDLIIIDQQTLQTKYSSSWNLPFNADASNFCNYAYNLLWGLNLWNNIISCDLKYLNSDLEEIPLNSKFDDIYGYQWTVTFAYPLRDIYSGRYIPIPKNLFNVTYINATSIVDGQNPQWTQEQISEQSSLINGTFRIAIEGNYLNFTSQSVDFPTWVSAQMLQTSLRKFYGINGIKVYLYDPNPSWPGNYPRTWTIHYFEGDKPFPGMSFETDNLTGGVKDTYPYIDFTRIKNHTFNLLFSPQSYQLMRTVSNNPPVVVTVNNISSFCLKGACEYNYIDDTPVVNLLTMNSTAFQVGLNKQILKNTSKVQFKLLEQNSCKNIKILSNKTFVCTYFLDSNNNPLFPGGQFFPSVYIEGIGYLEFDGIIQPLKFDFELGNPQPSNGTVAGGLDVILNGKGLPTNASDLTIKICDIQVQIIKLTQTTITVLTPQIQDTFTDSTKNCTITVKFPKYSAESVFTVANFTYQKQQGPKISSLSKKQANPTKKGILYIYGTKFDVNGEKNISNVNVYLKGVDIDKKYRMRVFEVNDTQIKVGLSGGLSGNYTVFVEIKGKGFAKNQLSDSSNFEYANKISNISPNTGSYFGGRQIQISGSCFSPDILQNSVTVGSGVCTMTSATEGKIKCVTPGKDQSSLDMDFGVTVMSRQIQKSICTDNCKFSYLSIDQSPLITGINYYNWDSVGLEIIISGVNMYKTGFKTTVIAINNVTNSKFTYIPTVLNDTELRFKSLSMPAGFYYVFLSIQQVGYSNITVVTVTKSLQQSTSYISTQGGLFTFKGYGLPLEFSDFSFYMQVYDRRSGLSIEPRIVTHTSEIIQFELPPKSNDTQFGVRVYNSMYSYYQTTVRYVDSLTSKAVISSSKSIPWKNTDQITLQITKSSTYLPDKVYLQSTIHPQQPIQVDWGKNTTHIWIKNHTLQPGNYRFKIFNEYAGFFEVNDTLTVQMPNIVDTFKFTVTNLSVEGGYIIINHNASLPASFGKYSTFTINDVKAQIVPINSTSSKLIYTPFVRSDKKLSQDSSDEDVQLDEKQRLSQLQQTKKDKIKKIDLQDYVKWSDSGSKELTSLAFDGVTKSTYYSSSNTTCQIGVFFGSNHQVEISKIRFYPNKTFFNPGKYLKGAKFQGSNDNSTWTLIQTLSSKMDKGWNSIQIKKENRNAFRYFRFVHNSSSGCSMGEIVLRGIKITNPLFTNQTASTLLNERSVLISYFDGLTKFTWNSSVLQYVDNQTPIVQTVSPKIGNVKGGQTITITGKGFAKGTPQVLIDSKVCIILTSNDTTITCRTSPRLETPVKITFEVNVDGKAAIIKESFKYVYRWSDIDTWGVDLPPVYDDLVYVPPNMHLLIDQSTPKLAGLIAENSTIEIADQSDIQVHTANLVLYGAKLIAGTAQNTFKHKLTFTFYGKQDDKQIPFFGNKGIGCTNCQISLHGAQKEAWTRVDKVTQNTNEVYGNFSKPLGWNVGDQIAVSSISYDYLESQKMIIANINQTIDRLNFWTEKAFKYNHSSVYEQTKTGSVWIGAEVGSLTRNIKLQGDENSDSTQYGIHFTIIGEEDAGLDVKISNVELKNCGQPKKSRHCINFNRNKELFGSYVKNSSAYDTYAKFISVQSTSYLTIESNVGYRVKGHNIELKDGTERFNTIRNNLMISALPYYRDMQTDVMVANYYISNPQNNIENNVAAGSYYYGFLYDFKSKPDDGIYLNEDLCVSGLELGQNSGNMIHSVRVLGMRIRELYARNSPCEAIRNNDLLDPWSLNPSKLSLFKDYVIYKNQGWGMMCDEIGHVSFNNFSMIQNYKGHMQFHVMNFTRQNVVIANSTFVGLMDTKLTPAEISSKALTLPRSGSINITNVLFSKFVQTQLLVQTCALCNLGDLYTTTGQEYFVDKVEYRNNLNPLYLDMLGVQKQIIYDLDGSFSNLVFDNKTRTKATIVKGYNHILNENDCYSSQNSTSWDSAALCGPSVKIRKIVFMNIYPTWYIDYYPFWIGKTENATTNASTGQAISGSLGWWIQPQAQIPNSVSVPFVSGSTYQIKTTYFDFNQMSIQGSKLLGEDDKAIILKFDYTENRELFEVVKLRNNNRSQFLINSTDYLNAQTCKNGDYFHNNTIRQVHICISGKNTTLYELVDIKAIYCRYDCPKPPVIVQNTTTNSTNGTSNTTTVEKPHIIDWNICIRQNFTRKWSNASQWPNEKVPVAGQNVTVHCNWTMELDVDPAPAAQMIIDGHLFVPQNASRQLINITAESIWVRLGSLVMGNDTDSFDNEIVIQLNGASNDRGYVIDPTYGGRKNLVVSGRLQIFGPQDYAHQTFLLESAQISATEIQVNDTTGWRIGDEIIISTSSHRWQQSEKVKIQDIFNNTVKFTPKLSYFHFGSLNNTIFSGENILNTASKVIYVSRNIKIVPGPDESFGTAVFVYGFLDTNQRYEMGSVYLRGVQIVNGGQGNGFDSALAFKNTAMSNDSSIVRKCSFNGCGADCVRFNNAKKVYFEHNVLYDATRSHIKSVQLRQASISNNIMIKAKRNPVSQDGPSVCLDNKEMLNSPAEDNLTIANNQCYGSEDFGFILPYLPCKKELPSMSGNIAAACGTGFFMVKVSADTSKCLICQSQSAINCKYGVLGNPDDVTNLTYNKLNLAGNQDGLILRLSTKEKNNTVYVTNSYISALSNPSCKSCNQNGSQCSLQTGIRLLSVTEIGPGTKLGYNSTLIKSSSPVDGKTFILNTEFNFFKFNYSATQHLKNCKSNFMFRAHDDAIDLVGSAYLYSSKMTQSDKESVAFFKPFDTKYLGLEGGCGQMNCTSLENYFIQDYSGDVLGFKGSKALPNNLYFSNKTKGCEYKETMNGYLCDGTEDVSVLEFESIARDYNLRIVWPVNLISHGDDGVNNSLNVEKQWSYKNGYPEGKRKARFSSLIKLNNTYNLTFYNRAPADMIFQIQKKNPDQEDFAWVKLVLEYPEENSIRLKANDKDVNPIILLDNKTESDPVIEVCGSYKYVYNKKYIEYILTTDCKIRMSFVNSVKASIRMDQAVTDFFTNNGTGKFIDKMCAILGITDTSRLKIVGVYTGSTIVDFYIEQHQQTTEQNATQAASATQTASTVQQLNQKLTQVIASGVLQTQFTASGLGTILSVSSTVVLINESGQFQTDMSQNPSFNNNESNQPQKSNNTLILIVSVSVGTVVIVLAAAIVYFRCVRNKNLIEEESIVDEIKMDKSVELVNEVIELNAEPNNMIPKSYFDERKAINLQKLQKANNKKLRKDKFATYEKNSSFVSFKNPFDELYPQESNQQLASSSQSNDINFYK